MSRPKTKHYRTYSFKCLEGRDDDLIAALEAVKKDRSAHIRKALSAALGLPLPADSAQPVDVETLRAELTRFASAILENMPTVVVSDGHNGRAGMRRALRDVNDKGANIPDFD